MQTIISIIFALKFLYKKSDYGYTVEFRGVRILGYAFSFNFLSDNFHTFKGTVKEK